MTKIKEKFVLKRYILISKNTLIEDFQAQVEAIRPSAKWSMLLSA